MIGTSIGTYRITAKLGAGGMGEVYRATDTKLKRDVALKVLPEAFAHDPERLARFEREAEVLASLNHPNIAQIYGVVEDRALVMELVEGAELKGPLSFDEAWAIMSQVAAALDYAHEKGVVHRDLKPANIKVTPDGVVKLLDFGLAKAFTNQRDGSPNVENSPTLTIGATEIGVILGTAAYMAPEQAKGKSLDKRADIWAFGVVLYELLTGERLFKGEDVSETLAQVLTKEPDLNKAPVKARKLLARCLEKDPRKRLRDIGEVGWLLEDGPMVAVTNGVLIWKTVAVVAILIAAVASFVAWRAKPRPVEKPLVYLDADLGRDVSLGSVAGADAILAPDGRRLVYVSENRLFTRRLDQTKASELVGTEGAYEPFFSPDGQWVAFFGRGKLQKISVDGGAAVTLCDTGNFARGGSWGDDGNIIAVLTAQAPLSRIPSAGGAPSPVTELAQGEVSQQWPQILPGNKAVLFTSNTSTTAFGLGNLAGNIDVLTLSDHRRKTLVRGGIFGRYLPVSNGTGYLVYVNSGTLFAVPFDPSKLEMLGAPAPVLEQIAYNIAARSAQFDFARNGTLIYQTGGAAGGLRVTVQWLDTTGKMEPLLAKAGAYGRPSLSPDGQRLALEITDSSGTDVWIYEWRRGTLTRLTFGGSADEAAWSPDGRYIALRTAKGMSWTRADGSDQPQPLTQSPNRQSPWSFTPDGKRLAFHEVAKGGLDLWTVPLEIGDAGLRAGKPEVFLATPSEERYPSFSPDGKWLAYVSNESGTQQVYVRAFPNKGGKWQISNEGGVYPIWAHSGHELFFEGLDSRIMAAGYITKGDSFMADKPRLWSDKKLAGVLNANRSFDVAPDGQHIAALFAAEGAEGSEQTRSHLVFLENFFDELRRRVPVTK